MLSKSNIGDLRDEYENERVFLIGNGPSLSNTPLSKLDDEFTLSMNRISHIYPETDWRPTMYYNPVPPRHSTDGTNEARFITDNIDEHITCFIHSDWKDTCGSHTNVFYLDRWLIDSRENLFQRLSLKDAKTKKIGFIREFWSDDVTNFIYHCHAMYGAIQLAAYLGFDEMYFVGCDLGYEYINPHMVFDSGLDPYRFSDTKISYFREAIRSGNFLPSLVNGIAMKLINKFDDNKLLNILLQQEDDSHFSSDYFTKLYIYDPTEVEKELRKSHIIAKRICRHNGIDMYNATIGGELEVYPRVELEEIIS